MSGELFDTTDDLKDWENMEDGFDLGEREAAEPAEEPAAAAEEAPVETAPADAAEPEPDEPATEPEEEPEPEPEPEPAALREQIAVLEKRIADKDEFSGRLSEEVGELRAQLQNVYEQQRQPQVADWDDLIDENPARAYQVARQAGDQYRMQQAKEAWDMVAPGASEMWEQNLYLYGKLQSLEQRFTETTQPLQAQQNLSQVAAAYDQMRQTYPEFEQFEDAMAQTLETDPVMREAFTRVLHSGDYESQFKALESIYLVTAGRKSDTLREAAKNVAREHAAETLRAKQEAQVVSASASIDTDRPKTAADVIGAEWDEMERSRADGWQIRP